MARQRHGATGTKTATGSSRSRGEDEHGEGRHSQLGRQPRPGLYLVATPIGNMGDITLRAIETLKGADLVACEDTRVTAKLMARLGLDRPLMAYHEHNADKAGPILIERLKEGAVVALVSDAGTPLVSDPGARLVRASVEAGLFVTAIPGPSAALAALLLSGLPAERFLFAGFTPPKGAARRTFLRGLEAVDATLILFESPNRLAESLADMAIVLGDRPAAVARELTKLHEEVVRATLPELARRYGESGPPKGEVVVVIGPPAAAPPADAGDVDARLAALVEEGASVKDAAALVAAETGHPRRDIYARALRLFRGSNE